MKKIVGAALLFCCCWGCGGPATELPPASKAVAEPGLQGPAFRVSIEMEGESKPVSTEHPFRNGQSFRFLIQPASSLYLNVFYRDESRALAVFNSDTPSGPDAGAVQAPAGETRWLRMDENPGTEQFLILASQDPLPQLAFGRDTIPAGYLENELDALRQAGSLVEAVRVGNSYEWPEATTSGQALLAPVPLQHQ